MSAVRDTVFLLTDVEGSTRLWDQAPEAMATALARHDRLIAGIVASHGGELVKQRGEGDSTFSVFADPVDALAASLGIQRALASEVWPEGAHLRVRIAIHAGPVEARGHDYFGDTVNRTARLRAAAHGGQILITRPIAEAVDGLLPDRTSLEDLGVHRLRDLARPERIFQLCHPDLERDFPPILTLDRRTHNLPSEATSFIGRDRELENLPELIRSARLVTLSGAGGSGKTRLAIRLAHELAGSFSDGAWLLELAPITDPEAIWTTLADVLGVRSEPGRTIEESLLDRIREQHLLIVVDNCEHLIDACCHMLTTLLSAAPDVHALTTSREVLGIPGERTVHVDPLPTPRADEPRDALADVASVRLFLDRFAHAGAPKMTHGELAAAAEICRQLDGIPLAIEIAAAKARALGIMTVRDRLGDRFGLLAGGNRVALSRHKTLRALIDWSFDLLAPDEQRLLAQLASFMGGWTIDAAEAVCRPADAVAQGLASLRDKSMIERDDSGRFRMLETIREYAQERLSHHGEATAVRDRHLDWVRASVAENSRDYATAREPLALQLLADERANVRAALAWAEQTRDPVAQVELIVRLSRFWELHGHWAEGIEATQRALAAAADAPRAAQLWICLSRLRQSTGDYAAAQEPAERARVLARISGDQAATASALYELGSLALARGNLDDAEALMQEALMIRRAIGDELGIAHSLTNLSYRRTSLSDFEGAEAVLQEALAIFRSRGDRQGISWALTSLSNNSRGRGDEDRCRIENEEALALRREIGDDNGVADSLTNLGQRATRLGDPHAARNHHREARRIYLRLGQRAGVGWSTFQLAEAEFQCGNLDLAETLFLELLRRLSDEDPFAGVCLARLGAIAAEQGRVEIGLRCLTKASTLITEALDIRFGIDGSCSAITRTAREALGSDSVDEIRRLAPAERVATLIDALVEQRIARR